MNKVGILEKTEKFAQYIMANIKDPVHDFSHVLRVRQWAKKLAHMEKVDSFKIEMVALLHDIGRGKEDYKRGLAHAEMSAVMAEPYLKKIKEISLSCRQEILEAVKRHSKGRKKDSKLTQVFQDADRLDALGVIGIARSILGARNMPFCSSPVSFKTKYLSRDEIDAKKDRGEEPYNDAITCIIFAKSLYRAMNTKSGKILGKSLARKMDKFLSQLKKELL